MQERLLKVFVDGLNDMDIVDVQMYVIRALDDYGRRVAYKSDPFYKGLQVKRVTIGDNTFLNPQWCKEKDAIQTS